MSSARRPRLHTLRARLLSGVTLLACSAGVAAAQTPAAPAPAPASTTASPAAATSEPLASKVAGAAPGAAPARVPTVVEADTVDRDDSGKITAVGDVQAQYQNRNLRADTLHYDPDSQIIVGTGNVQIYDDTGSAQFASKLTTDDAFDAGVAIDFSARKDNEKFASASAVRYNEALNELNKAIFTPCEICTEKGDPKSPTWSIAADTIIQDSAHSIVYYRNATIMVHNIPILWLPIFWHADPAADRLSGFLRPTIQVTRRRGFTYEQPYLWSISPSQDLIIRPQLNTNVNPFLDAEWRKRFYSGVIDARVGYTYGQDFNTGGVKFGDDRSKAFILASGKFTPFQDWTLGFSAEHVADRLLFDEYSIRQIYENRGIFLSDDRILLSQAYAVRQDQNSYISISAMDFQSLRPNLTEAPNAFGIRPFEADGALPFVGPLIEAHFDPENPVLGGRLQLLGDGVMLTRQDSPTVPGQPGIDSTRATLEADWRSSFTFKSGIRVEPFLDGRGDYYHIQDQTPEAQNVTRALGTAGIDVSWPFIGKVGATTIILEPLAQLAISPNPKLYPSIPNEDSIAFDFDDTNLFQFNKSPGFDLYEGGQRLNVGLRATAEWDGGHDAEVLIGRSFRAQANPVFAAGTGLQGKSSDWIFAADANPIDGLSFFSKARLDDQNLTIHEIEFGADVKLAFGDGFLRYLKEDQDFEGLPRQDIEAQGEVFLTKNWGVSFDAIHDLATSTWRRRTVGVVYRDECTRVELIYENQGNPVLGGRSSGSVALRLNLAINGDAIYSRRDRP